MFCSSLLSVMNNAWREHHTTFSTHLKNRPIPSTWTRSFLRCFRSQSLLLAARATVPPPTKSHKPLFINIPFLAGFDDTSELLSLNWLLLQQSGKLLLKAATGSWKLDQSVRDLAAIFHGLFHVFVFLVDIPFLLLEVSCVFVSLRRSLVTSFPVPSLVLQARNQDGGQWQNERTRLAKESSRKQCGKIHDRTTGSSDRSHSTTVSNHV